MMENKYSDGPLFGQLVIGPAGSGKTTYCEVMANYLREMGRNVITVNMDPANDVLRYKPTIDISNLITVNDAMNTLNLGPNGALLYCMDFLDANFEWLLNEIIKVLSSDEFNTSESRPYILFDSPGQVELFTNHHSLKNVFNKLNKCKKANASAEQNKISLDLRLVAVNLIDSHYANDPNKFISVVINCLSAMLHLEMSHINVLSKIDLIQTYGKTNFGLDFYCEMPDLNYLVEQISDDPFLEKFKKLTKSLAGIIEDYSLVSFIPLNINNARSIIRVLRAIDKANGYYLMDLNTSEQIENFYKHCEAADFEANKYGNLLDNNANDDED